MTLPASSSHSRAEQREIKRVGSLEVWAKSLQQRTRSVSKHYLLDATNQPGLAHNFGLDPWIADGRGG